MSLMLCAPHVKRIEMISKAIDIYCSDNGTVELLKGKILSQIVDKK